MSELTELEKRMREKYTRLDFKRFRVSLHGKPLWHVPMTHIGMQGYADDLARALARIVEEETAGVQQELQEMRTAAESYEKMYSETLTRLGRSEQLRNKAEAWMAKAREMLAGLNEWVKWLQENDIWDRRGAEWVPHWGTVLDISRRGEKLLSDSPALPDLEAARQAAEIIEKSRTQESFLGTYAILQGLARRFLASLGEKP